MCSICDEHTCMHAWKLICVIDLLIDKKAVELDRFATNLENFSYILRKSIHNDKKENKMS